MSRTRDFYKPDTACRQEFFERLGVNTNSKKAYHGYGKHGTVFVHCHNHLVDSVAGEVFHDYPFDEDDKIVVTKLFKKILAKYKIEALSFCCMSNHYHALLVSDNQKFSLAEMATVYNKFYEKQIRKKTCSPLNQSSPKCKRMADHSNDISAFLRDFQWAVTRYYNQKNNRKGTLWRTQFKSVLVERSKALLNMIAYIEMNPVRAGIVNDPADYPHSFWGEWNRKGRHPFQNSFSKHMRILLAAETSQALHNKDDLQKAFRAELTRQMKKNPISISVSNRDFHKTEDLAFGSRPFRKKKAIEKQIFRRIPKEGST